MGRFNKVNDLFATTSDPQAWEFRHPLFRRGEPHLLASIKRKSARPTNTEAGQATSPTDDPNEKVAGWMRPDLPYGSTHSPPREPPSRVYGYNLQTGETVLPRGVDSQHRPISRGRSEFPGHHASTSVSSRSTYTPMTRFHPDPGLQPLQGQRYGSYSDSNLYGQSAMGDAHPQVAVLEDQVRRLSAAVNEERAENARNHLNTTSYMLQMLDWISGQTREYRYNSETAAAII